ASAGSFSPSPAIGGKSGCCVGARGCATSILATFVVTGASAATSTSGKSESEVALRWFSLGSSRTTGAFLTTSGAITPDVFSVQLRSRRDCTSLCQVQTAIPADNAISRLSQIQYCELKTDLRAIPASPGRIAPVQALRRRISP